MVSSGKGKGLLEKIKQIPKLPYFRSVIGLVFFFIIFPLFMLLLTTRYTKVVDFDPFRDPQYLLIQTPSDLDEEKIARFRLLTCTYDQDELKARLPDYCTQFAKDMIQAHYESPPINFTLILCVLKNDPYKSRINSELINDLKHVYKCKYLKPYFESLFKPIVKFWASAPIWDIVHIYIEFPADMHNLRKALNNANWLAKNNDEIFQKTIQKFQNLKFVTTLLKAASLHPGKSSISWSKPTAVWIIMAKEYPNWKKELFSQLLDSPVPGLSEFLNESPAEFSNKLSLHYNHCTKQMRSLLSFVHHHSDFYACHKELCQILSPLFPLHVHSLAWYAAFDPKAFKTFIFYNFQSTPIPPNDLQIFFSGIKSYIERVGAFSMGEPTLSGFEDGILKQEYTFPYLQFETKIPCFISEKFFLNDFPSKRLFELTNLEETPNQFLEFDVFWNNSPQKDDFTKIYLLNLYFLFLDSLAIDSAQKKTIKEMLNINLLLAKPDPFSAKYLCEYSWFGNLNSNFTADLSQIDYHKLSHLIKFFIERDGFDSVNYIEGAKFLCRNYENGMLRLKKRNLKNEHANAVITRTFLEIVVPIHSNRKIIGKDSTLRPSLLKSSPSGIEVVDKYCEYSQHFSKMLSPQSCLSAEFNYVFIKTQSIKDFKQFILMNAFTWRKGNYKSIRKILEFVVNNYSDYGFGIGKSYFYRDCYILFQLGFTILQFNSNISVFSKNKLFFERLLGLAFDEEASMELIIDSLKLEFADCFKATNEDPRCFKTLLKFIKICETIPNSNLYSAMVYVKTLVSVRLTLRTQRALANGDIIEGERLNRPLLRAVIDFLNRDLRREYRYGCFYSFYKKSIWHLNDIPLLSDLKKLPTPEAPFGNQIYYPETYQSILDQFEEQIKKFIEQVESLDFSVKENTRDPILSKYCDLYSFYVHNIIGRVEDFYKQQHIKEKSEEGVHGVGLEKYVKEFILKICSQVASTEESPLQISDRFDKYCYLEHVCFASEYLPDYYEIVLRKKFNDLKDLIIENFLCPMEMAHLVNSFKNSFLVVKKLKEFNPILTESATLEDYLTKVGDSPNLYIGQKLSHSLLRILCFERDSLQLDEILKQFCNCENPLQAALRLYKVSRQDALDYSSEKGLEPVRFLKIAFAVVCYYDKDFPISISSISYVWDQLVARLQAVIDSIEIDEEIHMKKLFKIYQNAGEEALFLWDYCRELNSDRFYETFQTRQDLKKFYLLTSDNPLKIISLPPGPSREQFIARLVKANFLYQFKERKQFLVVFSDYGTHWAHTCFEGNRQAKLDEEYEVKKSVLLNELISHLQTMKTFNEVRLTVIAQKLVDLRKSRPDLNMRMLDLGPVKFSLNCTIQQVVFLSISIPFPLNRFKPLNNLDGNSSQIQKCFIDYVENILMAHFPLIEPPRPTDSKRQEEILAWLKDLSNFIGPKLVKENETLLAYSKFTNVKSVKEYIRYRNDKLRRIMLGVEIIK
jgi:hypothetical protein